MEVHIYIYRESVREREGFDPALMEAMNTAFWEKVALINLNFSNLNLFLVKFFSLIYPTKSPFSLSVY